ncbi:SDR family oxidoreductase [Halobacteria archaeon AArc-dxtr1]|nr:SDR family oxidoreductase [Halobacteria archaeon AArc-dxtr1]
MMSTLAGQCGIVTGASSGIGRATAAALAAKGVSLTIAARSDDRLAALAEELRADHDVDVQPVPTDVRDSTAVRELVEAAVERHGGLDLVVDNAGTGIHGEVTEIEDEEFRRAVETNVGGTFYVAREVLPTLLESGGNLVFVGSMAAQFPFPANPVYAGTKAWVRQFAHSVEARYGSEGVAVTVVNPGGVRTAFEFAGSVTQTERYDEGEAPEPAEIAESIVFACSQSSAATVHEIDVYPRDQLSDE